MKLIARFIDEYTAWCVKTCSAFSLIYSPRDVVHAMHNPNATTNVANPMPSLERQCIDDANGTMTAFANDVPSWAEFSCTRL